MRSQVVLLRDNTVLLACHERSDSSCYWVLPGGGVEEGETPEEAAIREVLEETGLEVTLDRLLFIDGPRETLGVSIRQPRYTFLARITGGNLNAIEDEFAHPVKGRLTSAAWMPFESPGYDLATRDTLRLVKESLDNS